MYYIENINQAAIARNLNLSVAKVNRLLKLARQRGMVRITLDIPSSHLIDLENRIATFPGLLDVIITPSINDSVEGDISLLAQEAANYFLFKIQPGDTICISGGRTLYEVINRIKPSAPINCTVVPALGGVQRQPDMDVNALADSLARRLGGESFQFHAPAMAATVEECQVFYSLTHVRSALDKASHAEILLASIGTVLPGSSYFKYRSLPSEEIQPELEARGGVGEILGRVIDRQGGDCVPSVNERAIGLRLQDFHQIPVRIGVAAGSAKALPVAAAIPRPLFYLPGAR